MEANSQKKQMQICRLEEAILGSQCPRPPLSRASMLIAHNQVSHRLIPMMMVILMMLRKLNTGRDFGFSGGFIHLGWDNEN